MQYRDFGKTGLKVSALGFGMMRLPLLDGTQGSFDRGTADQIDKETSIKMLRQAIDNGLNYVDTAYNYLDGNSELITGEALKDGYREKVFLATKSPVWLYENEDDFDRLLDEQLAKLQTDHIDFYLLHALHGERFDEKIVKFNTIEKMKAAKAAGKIRYMGFSFHDNLDAFKRIVDAADWDFCQIQLNYVDVEYQAGIAGLEYAGCCYHGAPARWQPGQRTRARTGYLRQDGQDPRSGCTGLPVGSSRSQPAAERHGRRCSGGREHGLC